MLKIVSTPIGNLGDFSPRAAEALQQVDIIACEDTRTTRKLITLCSLDVRARLVAYHDHNGHEMRPRLLSSMQAGKQVALVSDAGTPLISDPGMKLVRDARAAGHAIIAIPGASAPIAALSVSGLPSDRFTFAGFLPPKAAARQRALEGLKAARGGQSSFSPPLPIPLQ